MAKQPASLPARTVSKSLFLVERIKAKGNTTHNKRGGVIMHGGKDHGASKKDQVKIPAEACFAEGGFLVHTMLLLVIG